VKPQFEVGRDLVGRGGIVRDPESHAAAVRSVVLALAVAGLAPRAAMPSPVLGQKGNREFLVAASFGGDGEDEANLVAAALA
jgi:23S rRNA (cytidine1920-2'-O)/16S rRNA (cytidine1409-2'-O)-methyltransferase